MTGLFLFPDSTLGKAKHIHIAITLEHSHISHLFYWNPRRFGRVYLFDRKQLDQFLQRRFGVDPFSMTHEAFCLTIGQSRGRVKALLLNQHKIAGIGNIYANEILYRAGIHPHAKGSRLSKASLTATLSFRPNGIARGDCTWRIDHSGFLRPRRDLGALSRTPRGVPEDGDPLPTGMRDDDPTLDTGTEFFFLSRVPKAELKAETCFSKWSQNQSVKRVQSPEVKETNDQKFI